MRGGLLPAFFSALGLAVAAVSMPAGVAEAAEKLPSKSDASCLKCHHYDHEANLLAGKLVDVSVKAKAIQLKIDKDMEVIYYDDSTVVNNAESLRKIPKQESVRISYYRKDGKPFAKLVEVKKGVEVPKDQLMSAGDIAKLVAAPPDKGKYVLLDSRPADMYNHGHIPFAVSMPFPAFDKLADKLLPKDKEITQVYYCAGFS